MKVFVSWSGDLSREVAETLSSFLQHVVRGIDTFVSVHNIEAGDRWEARLDAELAEAQHAVVCVTRSNQNAPWLNYEAGALAKSLGRSRVIPYTIGLRAGELLEGPIGRFQAVASDEAGTWTLVRTLNQLSPKPQSEAFVREDFELWWPRLHEKLLQAKSGHALEDDAELPSDRALLIALRRDVQEVMAQLALKRGDEPQPSDQAQRALSHALDRDALTNLLSRSGLRQLELQGMLPSVVVCVDLDGMKPINDELGHIRGDDAIKLAASVLQQQLSAASAIARVGGDEFIAWFQDLGPIEVTECMSRALAALKEQAQQAGFRDITFCAGVSSDADESLDMKTRKADLAMYAAKKAGAGQIRTTFTITTRAG